MPKAATTIGKQVIITAIVAAAVRQADHRRRVTFWAQRGTEAVPSAVVPKRARRVPRRCEGGSPDMARIWIAMATALDANSRCCQRAMGLETGVFRIGMKAWWRRGGSNP